MSIYKTDSIREVSIPGVGLMYSASECL